MNKMPSLDKDAIVAAIRHAYPDVQAVYLFGSFASGDPWPSSDVDIALLLPEDKAGKLDVGEYMAFQARLAELCKRQVDLVNLRCVNTVFQHEIIFHSETLYCGDRNALDEFEMITMSMYQRLNEERAEILAEFAKTNRAYDI